MVADGVGMGGYLAVAEVGDPDLGDAGGGVAGQLGAAVVAQGGVGYFDDQVDVGGGDGGRGLGYGAHPVYD